ncbi:MAG: phage portal protein [Rickettsiales bacterium]|jgi:HK97 family phage portal protein|nr:phage portal protein [Rickettsiales bacterium]
MFGFFSGKKEQKNNGNSGRLTRAYYQDIGKAIWTDRNYVHMSEESYVKNVIANRCISIVARSASSVKLYLKNGAGDIVSDHRVLGLLKKPNPSMGSSSFFETIYAHRLIAGNAYIQAIFTKNSKSHGPHELFILRPDRVTILAGNSSLPAGYRYRVNEKEFLFRVDQVTGRSEILHMKNFHPTNDWYGLSQVEPAAYSIDQHNEASKWNQAILQNGAKPCGALIVKNDAENSGFLTDDQFERLREQLNNEFSGSTNAGKPLLLEGGLDWKEMSMTPKEMDFLEMKHSTARDIALSFGVPSQLIGIPGDNTYNNMAEARLFLWEQTILPMIDNVLSDLTNWLMPMFGENFEISYNKNEISPLSIRKENFWTIVNGSSFLSDEEKKRLLGLQ